MTHALPLRPHLGQLKRQARELLVAAKQGDPKSIHELRLPDPTFAPTLSLAQRAIARRFGFHSWSALKHHVTALQEAHPESLVSLAETLFHQQRTGAPSALERIRRSHSNLAHVDAIALAARSFTMVEARDVIAREAGYYDWSELLSDRRGDANPLFEKAAHCVVTGNFDKLSALIRQSPDLVRQHSHRAHRATLLHYVTANGVEDYRQQVPPNAVSIAELILRSGADPDALSQSYDGGKTQTPLYLLCSSIHPQVAGVTEDLVHLLCDHRAKVNGIENDGLPLATAIAFGITSAIDPLVSRGADVEDIRIAAAVGDLHRCRSMLDNNGLPKVEHHQHASHSIASVTNSHQALEQAFVYACMHNRMEIVDELRRLGVSACSTLANGETGLHWAAANNRTALAEQLVQAGARADQRDARWNASALDWASNGGHQDMVAWLLSHASPDTVDQIRYGNDSMIQSVVDQTRTQPKPNAPQTTPVNIQPESHRRLLDLAIEKNQRELVSHLLDRGADVRHVDSVGKTPLHVAAEHGRDSIIQQLIDRGANLECQTNWGMTPLEWAVNGNQSIAAKCLIDAGARVSLWSAAGLGLTSDLDKQLDSDVDSDRVSSALYIASRNGHRKAVDLLLRAGGDPDHRGHFGGTCLHWAAIGGHLDVSNSLLRAGADVQIRDDEFNATPAGWANERGHRSVVQRLIDAGTEVNIREAAEFGLTDIVRDRLSLDPNQVTFSDGVTPLQAARRRGHPEIVQLLVNAGAEL